MLREQLRTESAAETLPSIRNVMLRRRLAVWSIRVLLVAIWLVGWEITATYWKPSAGRPGSPTRWPWTSTTSPCR